MPSRHPASLQALVAKLTKQKPTTATYGGAEFVELADYPAEGQTTLVTSGLTAHARSMYRGMSTGFELVLVTRVLRDPLCERVADAVRDDLAAAKRGDAYARVAQLPPRGIMYNGAFVCEAPPHLVFSTELVLAPALTERHRCGDGYVELIPVVPITGEELEDYDASPRKLIAQLRTREDLDDITARLGRKRIR